MMKQFVLLSVLVSLLLSILVSSTGWAESDSKGLLSAQEYKTLLKNGQKEIDRNKELLHPRQIHTLIPDLISAAEAEEGQELEKADQGGMGAGDKNVQENRGGSKASMMDRSEEKVAGDSSHEKEGEINQVEKSKNEAEPNQERLASIAHIQTEKSTRSHARSTKVQGWGFSQNIEVTPSVSHPEMSQEVFGISIGTQIKVKLIGGATNVQRNRVRFQILEPIVGKNETLPAGTLIFGRPFANKGYDRLQVSINKGITPEGVEFTASGWVRGHDGLDGLIAKIVSDGYVIDRSLGEAVSTAGDVALNRITDPGIGVASVKSGLSNLKDEKTEETDKTYGRPEFIVQAQSQEATLEINETF